MVVIVICNLTKRRVRLGRVMHAGTLVEPLAQLILDEQESGGAQCGTRHN